MKNEIKKAPVTAIRQAGLTLIELTIVLLILIALSGLLLPFVQGFVDKTHDSANTDSLKEVTKQILSYNNLYSGYPEDLESLIVAAGAPISGTPTVGLTLTGAGNVMGAMMRPNLFTTTAINGMELQQLNNAGIARVRTMYDDAGQGNHTLLATDATLPLVATTPLAIIDEQFLSNDMNPAGGGSQCSVGPSSGGAGAPLAITAAAVSPAALVLPGVFTADDDMANTCLAEMLNKTARTAANPNGLIDVVNNDYIVLGIGNDSSLIGRTMAEAPIHFAKVGGMNAANRYNHLLAVFEVRAKRMDGHMAATFVGTIMPMMRLEGQAQAQGAYYAGDGA